MLIIGKEKARRSKWFFTELHHTYNSNLFVPTAGKVMKFGGLIIGGKIGGSCQQQFTLISHCEISLAKYFIIFSYRCNTV